MKKKVGALLLMVIVLCISLIDLIKNVCEVRAESKEPVSYEDVLKFPLSYREALFALKTKHPNWTFEVYDAGLEWEEVLYNQTNPAERSLLPTYFPADMVSKVYGDGWSVATPKAVEYYMDPRNWLTEKYIFQFEVLTYNEKRQNLVTVQRVLQNSFMSGVIEGELSLTYSQAFYDIGRNLGVNPVHLASRVLQEQGLKGDSELISGIIPGYEGYYNYFNIQASGATREEIVINGLNEAKSEGWTSRYAALYGGSKKVSKNYILAGQDTLYFQKFDIDDAYYGRYWHQYMQNLAAPSNEGARIYNSYQSYGVIDSDFVFKIPVYRSMPGEVSHSIADGIYYICPAEDDKLTLDVAEASKEPGANVGLWTNEKNEWQQWKITPIEDGYYKITNVNSGHNLDATAEGDLIQWEDNGADNQKWIIREKMDGTFSFISKFSEKYISTAQKEPAVGMNVETHILSGENDQRFKIFKVEDMMPVRTNGWVTYNDNKYYYKNGELCRDSVVSVDSDNYYFDKDGALVTSKDIYLEDKGYMIRCLSNGKLAKGFVTENGKKQYFDPKTGAMAEGVKIIDNKAYLFERNTGVNIVLKDKMYIDKISEKEERFVYFDKDGVIHFDEIFTIDDDKDIVMADGSGYLVTGWCIGIGKDAKIIEEPDSIDGREIRYFDIETGRLLFGETEVSHRKCKFNELTGILEEISEKCPENGWKEVEGKFYWYEDYERQGSKLLADGTPDLSYRGKEVYDKESDAWYWLDNINGGARTISKDVYQESDAGICGEFEREDGSRYGKWVRYDADGHMIKGWCVGTAENARRINTPMEANGEIAYYFDPVFGTMYKGHVVIGNQECFFDENTGIAYNGWLEIDSCRYWYENGVRQGYLMNDDGSVNMGYRGKEIYDPATDAWYWLDNVDFGRMTTNKDVYQESDAGECGEFEREDKSRYGKWVRYDENGHMVKGWHTNENGTYFFDYTFGTMYKGWRNIDGVDYYFDEVTGVMR